MFVVTNTFQPAFTGISSFFFVPDPKITLEEGLGGRSSAAYDAATKAWRAAQNEVAKFAQAVQNAGKAFKEADRAALHCGR
jgi:hypothetical protein